MEALPKTTDKLALLYVEDESDAREMVSRMLAMNYPDLTLYAAENGAAGLALFKEHGPEIIMTDINMPVMDGIRMSREIKALNPEAIIVAVTAHSDTSYLLSAIEIGINHYILKPINYEELFAVTDKIIEALQLKRLVREQNRRLVESERQLSEAQRIAHLGSWQWSLPDNRVHFSQELFRIFGLAPGGDPLHLEVILEKIHPEDLETVQKWNQEVLETERSPGPVFYRIVRPDSSVRIIRSEAEVIRDAEGRPVSVIGSSHDVTELKQAEEKIRTLTNDLEQRVIQRTAQLAATVKELESFSYLVSHDLRAPVARLEGFCRAMIEDCGNCSNDCSLYAERADRVVRQIKQIIDAFNNLSHYTVCRLVVKDVDLGALARDIAGKLMHSEPERQVDFVIAEPLEVKGDPRLLHVVVEHLLTNAWKFTAKKAQARIEVGVLEGKGTTAYFVRDNGAGFNMKYVEKLFKPFQTIHSPAAFAWNGTGTGLASVHSIVLRHGGQVWAEGEVDQGATFYFTLGVPEK